MRIYEIEAGEKQHIPDVYNQADNMKADKFYSLIERDCSDALYAMKKTGKLLYRGIKGHQLDIFHGKSRNYRQPLDSYENTQKNIDFYLRNSGFTALRSNSIFCTSGHAAGGYGTTYLIFPIDGFDFTWSEIIGDLVYSKLATLRGDDPNLVSNYKFKKTNFVGALNSGNEIYIHGEYYACSVTSIGNEIFDKIFSNTGSK
jgi:hypothetical protein